MKKCDICGNEFDESFDKCPNCNDVINNIELVDLSKLKEETTDSKSSIIFNEEDLSKKEELINRRNQSIKHNKRKKESVKLFSYLLLLMGMILLFIISFSSILEFTIIPFFHYIITVLLLFLSFNLTYQDKEVGYSISLITSISMILMVYERDYISAIIGVYIFTSSFKYLIKK